MSDILISLIIWAFPSNSMLSMEEAIREKIAVQDISIEAKVVLLEQYLGDEIDLEVGQEHVDEAFDWECATIVQDEVCIEAWEDRQREKAETLKND